MFLDLMKRYEKVKLKFEAMDHLWRSLILEEGWALLENVRIFVEVSKRKCYNGIL